MVKASAITRGDAKAARQPGDAKAASRNHAAAHEQRSARQRLLDAANELFYAEGVQTVGIDRIIDQAGVAKASLYNTFGSKEALIGAYLESRHEGTAGRLTKALDTISDPREKLLAVFDAQGELFTQPDFQGCAFVAASAEAPPGGTIEKAANNFRAWIRAMFVELATQASAHHPEELARQLHLLYDGAGLSARMDRDPTAARAAREAASVLLSAAKKVYEQGTESESRND
jgi:AcrR family transcriptional regulator